jgi:hypothetical protein
MSSELAEPQVDAAAYPTEGVRIGINHHNSTAGRHRIRLGFPPDIAKILRRGLPFPHICVDGDMAHGLRIWCQNDIGLVPTMSNAGSWSVSLPARRVQAREDVVDPVGVAAAWELDKLGPVLLIPRLPDELLPPPLLNKLPNSNVDHGTRMDRAETRLQRELRAAYDAAPEIDPEITPEIAAYPEPEPEPAPLTADTTDLKTALTMVNELVDRLGEDVVLYIDPHGRVQARRRIVQFVDL